jgi:hypothetical protein
LIRLQAYKSYFTGFFQNQRIGGSCWPYNHLFRFAGLFLAIFWPVGAENLCYLAGCTVDRWLIGPAPARAWDDLRLVGVKLIFLIVSRAVSLLGLSRREWWWKDAEILMLRHQLAVG